MKQNDSLMHVLLTDDDQDDLMLFSEAIKELSFSIQFSAVENGKDMLDLLKENFSPNIIFLDVNMPGQSGKDCLTVIRSDPKYNSIPVIMYSTSSSSEDIESCYRRGANLYVVKPFFFSDIVKMLEKTLSMNWKEYKAPSTKDRFVMNSY